MIALPIPLVPRLSSVYVAQGFMMLMSFRMIVTLLVVSASNVLAVAAEPIKEREVELFAAIESGEIEAELIAPSARQVFLRVDNKTTDMLRIQLPKAFAAVPVLAQMQPGIFPGGAQGGQLGLGQQGVGNGFGQNFGNQGGGSQGLGGGFNGGQGGQGQFGNQIGGGNQFGNQLGGNGAGRGFFRVPAGKVGKVAAQTFCLEHGKPDPTSKIKYRIVPVEQFVGSDERIRSLCELLADRLINQNTAQAAAWNLANGISFEQLAGMNRIQSKYTGNVRMFNEEELKTALNLVEKLNKQAAESQLAMTSSYVSE